MDKRTFAEFHHDHGNLREITHSGKRYKEDYDYYGSNTGTPTPGSTSGGCDSPASLSNYVPSPNDIYQHTEAHCDGDLEMLDLEDESPEESPEICFGMIQDASITSSQVNLQHQGAPAGMILGKRKKQKMIATTLVELRSLNPLMTAHLLSGEYIGLLDSRSSKGIIQLLLSFPSIRLQAFLLQPQNPIVELTSKPQPRSTPIYINIYGPTPSGDSAGKILSDNDIFLQHPKHNEKHLEYKNPHYFTGYNDEIINKSPVRLLKTVEEEVKTLFDVGDDSSLSEVEPGGEVRTPLLSHQKKAICFMLHREEGRSFGGSHSTVSIWKQERHTNGYTRFTNSITKETTDEQPLNFCGGILADGMGLGKSLTTLGLITSTMDQARLFAMNMANNAKSPKLRAKTTLIIAPASILDSWSEQINIHIKPGALNVYIYHGNRKEIDSDMLARYDIVITTYSTIRMEFFPSKRNSQPRKSPIREINWFRIVLDEAHIIREKSTQTSQAVCRLEAQRRWCLTGTPIQNKLHDFGTLLKFLRFPTLDSEPLFRRHIIKPLQVANGDGLSKLRLLIRLTCLRRNKDILGLPARIDHIQYIHLNPVDRQIYEACKKYSAMLIEHALTDYGNTTGQAYFGILQSILRLRQLCDHQRLLSPEVYNRLREYTPATEISNSLLETCLIEYGLCSDVIDPAETDAVSFSRCSHTICNKCSLLPAPRATQCLRAGPYCPICEETDHQLHAIEQINLTPLDDIRSAKVQALMQDLEHSRSKVGNEPEKSVVFSCWTKMLDMVGLALVSENIQFSCFDGRLSLQQRKVSLDRFRNDPKVNVLLISIGSGAVGLNLTVASRVYLMEPQWNPMVEQQALDRLHRIGQKREVTTTRYIIKNSIEESILDFQKRKLSLANLSLSQDSPASKGYNERVKELQALFK